MLYITIQAKILNKTIYYIYNKDFGIYYPVHWSDNRIDHKW